MKRRHLSGLTIVALGLARLPLAAQQTPLKPFFNEDGTEIRRAMPANPAAPTTPNPAPSATPIPVRRAVPITP